ncbi:MAG TPA: hypothetical protein VJZ94_02985 [Candidatus Paceibacterota bacterium]|nr:hypothetical protein [Candidatus Paceibacterota bacterium]
MDRFFTKTFFRFFFGFVVIIAAAFSVMIAASHLGAQDDDLDSVAHPQ